MPLTPLMDKTVIIDRQSLTQDAAGGPVRTFANVATGVSASIQQASSRTASGYAQRQLSVDTTVYTDAALDTLVSGGVKLGDRVKSGTETYVVQGVRRWSNASLSTSTLYALDCERRLV